MNDSINNCAVLMSTYNGEKYLSAQIESIFNQNNDITLFIRDDCSKDSTVDIIPFLAAHDA